MSKNSIKIYEDDSNWDQFVEESNEGTIFHKLEYLNSIPDIKFNIDL